MRAASPNSPRVETSSSTEASRASTPARSCSPERTRRVARAFRFGAGLFAGLDRQARRLAACLEAADLVGDLRGARPERRRLATVELQLLLPAVDVELRRMRALADGRRVTVRLGLLDAEPRQVRLDLRDPRGRGGFALARRGQARTRRLDAARELAVAPREQHLLPPAQLVPQPPLAPRLRRPALPRSALLLPLEHHVVHPREGLVRG